MQEKHITHQVMGYLERMGADAYRHEDYGRGVPDISFQLPLQPGGWIECKVIRDEKTTEKTKIGTILALTDAQRRWMLNRISAGGYCCIIAAKDNFWMHFNRHVLEHWKKLTWVQAREIGTHFNTRNDDDFVAVLQRDMKFQAPTLVEKMQGHNIRAVTSY